MKTYINLEVIDMKTEEAILVKKIYEQLSTKGFLLISNVEGFNQNEMKKLCQEFHSLPDIEKQKLYMKSYNPENNNIYRGMAPFIDNDESHKEFFDMGISMNQIEKEERINILYEKTPFPNKAFRKRYQDNFNHRFNLGIRLMQIIALGLGKERNYFDKLFKNTLSTFRTIYYKPRSEKIVKQNLLDETALKLTTPDHTDSGFLTVLSTLDYEGLQVLEDGKFKNVKPIENTFIINIGDCLSKISDNKLKATRHRVLDIGIERYSNPFFLEPGFSALIPKDKNDDKVKIKFGDFLIKKMTKKFGEWKDFDYTLKN